MKHRFTIDQQESLRSNEHVLKCSVTSITYNPAFKRIAVHRYQEGCSPKEIFREAGFDLDLIGRDKPKGLIKAWIAIDQKEGVLAFTQEKRGRNSRGRPKTIGLTQAEQIQRLETEVAYLKAENSFLAKLRAAQME
jgi:transposase